MPEYQIILRILAVIVVWNNTDILKTVFVFILKYLQMKLYDG